MNNNDLIDVEELIKNNKLVSCTRQTIQVPIEILLKPDKIDYYRDYVIKYDLNDMDAVKGTSMICPYSCISRDDYILNVNNRLKNSSKLAPTAYEIVKPVNVPLPNFKLSENNIFDISCHEDTITWNVDDESFLNKVMFNYQKNNIRLIIECPDENGNISKQTYYYHSYGYDNMFNPFSKRCLDSSIELVTIDYAGYLKYLNDFTKWDYSKYDITDTICSQDDILILEQ